MKYALLVVAGLGLLANDAHAYKISARLMSKSRDDADENENIQIKNIYGIPS
jgi:hypothetical protein